VAWRQRATSRIKLESRDRVIGFLLANKKRRPDRAPTGAHTVPRLSTVTGRGGRGYHPRRLMGASYLPRPSQCLRSSRWEGRKNSDDWNRT
jgi:hypothetical protein